ncbi:phytanoyl-CoA dioxygenase family protein [Niabella ginsengisoli]|uniref:Phytanoyl-CoA dioxygenase n=1 Tax=Niabella ginsengisoli TaxID=522298 RepID=A0ABS9SEI9_9BACT|nr:hypothetical protein [Niabella ginsengisoli]MCH5596758.1 hypothetical protein [Niabella ginsengisoli]
MSDILSKTQVEHFITEGFVSIDNAFTTQTANEVVSRLWKDIPFDRYDPESWTEPVVRLGMYSEKAFLDSINTPRLHTAFDQLVGADKWLPCQSVGAFPVRFPSDKLPNDTGKHVDAGFPGEDPGNYFEWRVNVRSKGRALLMLVLYSDVSDNDAPTIIYKKSHTDIARILSKEGSSGLSFMELAARANDLPDREEAFATGKAGTVYLCHPFLVHAAQAHTGSTPKFMAQPPLLLKNELTINGINNKLTPIEQAIRSALG